MVKHVSLGLILGVIFLFSALPVFADGKYKKIEISRDIVVNGVEIKKGKYRIEINEQEIFFWQGKNLITKATIKKEIQRFKADMSQIVVVNQNTKSVLKSLKLRGTQEAILFDLSSINVAPQ